MALTLQDNFQAARNLTGQVIGQIRTYGQFRNLQLTVVGLLAGQDIMVIGDSGTGKTFTVSEIAARIDQGYGYLNCSGDTDKITFTGYYRYDRVSGRERWTPSVAEKKDVVFTDEITRLAPGVQSALLEILAEKSFTDDKGVTHQFRPMLSYVFAGNPLESEGTYGNIRALNDRLTFALYYYQVDGVSAGRALHSKVKSIGDEIRKRQDLAQIESAIEPLISKGELRQIRETIKECMANMHDETCMFIGRIYEHFNVENGSLDLRVGTSNRTTQAIWKTASAITVLLNGDSVPGVKEVILASLPCLYAVVQPGKGVSEPARRRFIAEELVKFFKQDNYSQEWAIRNNLDLRHLLPEIDKDTGIHQTTKQQPLAKVA